MCVNWFYQGFLHPMLWDDVQLQEIVMLPYDIDGHCKYLLHCEPSKLMSSRKTDDHGKHTSHPVEKVFQVLLELQIA